MNAWIPTILYSLPLDLTTLPHCVAEFRGTVSFVSRQKFAHNRFAAITIPMAATLLPSLLFSMGTLLFWTTGPRDPSWWSSRRLWPPSCQGSLRRGLAFPPKLSRLHFIAICLSSLLPESLFINADMPSFVGDVYFLSGCCNDLSVFGVYSFTKMHLGFHLFVLSCLGSVMLLEPVDVTFFLNFQKICSEL